MLRQAFVGALLTLAAGIGVIAAAPAQANPTEASDVGVTAPRYVNLSETDLCPQGYFCAYEGTGLVGRGVAFFGTESNWGAIPAEFRWINNRARSGQNEGNPGALEDVFVYPLPGFVNDPRWPGVCIQNDDLNLNWGALRPESNRWFNNC